MQTVESEWGPMQTVDTKPDVVLYLFVTEDTLLKINDTQVIPIDAQKNWCLTLRESADEAWKRSSWFTDKKERWLLMMTLTTRGIGHYTRELNDDGEPLLSMIKKHRSWRFHADMPLHVVDTDGHLLLKVETEIQQVAGPG